MCNEVAFVRVWYLLLAEAGDLDPTAFSAIEEKQGEIEDKEVKVAESHPDVGVEYIEEVIK